MIRTAALLLCVAASAALGAPRTVVWRDAAGDWAEAARWNGGAPGALTRAVIAGRAEVRHASGASVVGGLLVGTGRGDDARLMLDDGTLVVRRSFVQIGEEDGSVAEVVVNGGALHNVSATYVGGANSVPGRKCRGALRVRGGSFVTRILTLGWGAGGEATLAIEGSRAAAVHALDYVTAGAYLEGVPSTNTFSFTLDERGVTPLTIQNPQGGLSLRRREAANVHRLRIALSAVPPPEDVTLIAANVPTKGEFDGLHEGAEISAAWQGREFRWKLTYRGGASGCDLVLRDVRGHRDGETVAKARARPATPEPLWRGIPLREPLPEKFEPAFEGARGFGAMARGGRGGREIAVENLADSGAGSLRAAVEAKGARTIVFRVGGTIALKSPLVLREPFVSIFGQTAPGDGITLRGQGMIVQTHDVVLRHLRVRPGEESGGQDAIEFYDAERCIADHCSFTWGADETCSIVGLSDAITIQHCLIAEGLNHAGHSMAAIAGGERTTWHGNLIAHCRTRNPRFAGVAWCDFRHNVIYDWGDAAAYGDFERVNFVGNWFKPGPSTKQKPLRFYDDSALLLPQTFFAEGNVMDGAGAQDDWLAIQCDPAARARAPFPAPAVRASSIAAVLDEAGATQPKRDAVDERIVRDARNGTGRIIDRVSDAADAGLRTALAEAGMKDPIRHDLQRPVDARLAKAKEGGWKGSGLFPGTRHVARSVEDVRALSGKTKPGDQVVLTGDDWKDARFTFAAWGTEAAPILFTAENARVTGVSQFTFHGENLVIAGLEFRDQTITEQHTVMLRLGLDAQRPATRCIVSGAKFLNCNTARHELRMWQLTVWGADNTIHDCEFRDYRAFGQCIAAGELPPPDFRLGLHILDCRFIDRPKVDDENGYEIIQIGGSGQMARPSGVLIAGNTFENCDGESEILTLKASDMVVRDNTFRGCQGALSLRMGDRILVQGNLFDGAGKPRTGGVGVMGADHIIVGNTFRDLREPRNQFQWTIYMPCGSSEKTEDERRGYGRAQNILITGNRFERCETLIAAGIYPRPEYPLRPRNIHVRGNVFTGTKAASAFGYVAPDVTGALPKELHEAGNQFFP